MKVLLISHNVFDNTDNMGKTLSAYFAAFRPEEIRQFYFHDDEPCTAQVCTHYYRFTDKDAVRSVFSKKEYGREIQLRKDSDETRTVNASFTAGKSPFSAFRYILRNTVWKLAKWNTEQFRSWLNGFQPDCIFFAGGDYSFSYRIALEVKRLLKVPLIVCTTDDYYLSDICAGAPFAKCVHKDLCSVMDEVMREADAIMTVSDMMSRTYGNLFRKPAYTLYNSAKDLGDSFKSEAGCISYLGNLGLGRADQIAEIGKALKKVCTEKEQVFIDVYSPETNPETLKKMTEENGIRFHGAVPYEKVKEILQKSMAVIHTESFSAPLKELVRYSLSTKIAESLLNAQCVFAYGPEDIASMEYLIQNSAAVCVTDPKDLYGALKRLMSEPEYRKRIHENARKTGLHHHSISSEPMAIRSILESVLKGKEDESTAD